MQVARVLKIRERKNDPEKKEIVDVKKLAHNSSYLLVTMDIEL